jgi:hypothetical protein
MTLRNIQGLTVQRLLELDGESFICWVSDQMRETEPFSGQSLEIH